MNSRALPWVVFACLATGKSYSQTATPPPAPRPFSIERLDPDLDKIIAPDAALELVGDRFGLTEGPVWVQRGSEGYLLFSDLISNVIYRWDPSGKVSVFLDKAGYSGEDIMNAGTQTRRGRMAVLMIGPNGEALDPQGRLVFCASPDGTVVRLEKDGRRTILAAKFQGKRFNGPNDVVVRSDGAVYFTDSDFGLRGGRKSPLKELSFNGVYLVKDGTVTLLLKDADLGGFPNGIALSPDQRYLYLNAGFKKMMRYELRRDGTLGAGSVFFEGGPGIADGMRTDMRGNLFSTGGAGPGEVRITSPDGKHLGTLHLPISDREPQQQICATNLTFGDPDGKGLYIAACEAVFHIRLREQAARYR
jgi:gluconolactonase